MVCTIREGQSSVGVQRRGNPFPAEHCSLGPKVCSSPSLYLLSDLGHVDSRALRKSREITKIFYRLLCLVEKKGLVQLTQRLNHLSRMNPVR